MIYFTSDTHYNHKNIVKGTSSWDDISRCRNFKTLSEHDDFIVNSINSIVNYDDIIYHLGDWSFGGIQNIEKFRMRLNCQEIHLILGNHDQHIEKSPDNFSHLFSSISHYKEIEVDGDLIVLSHWPMKIWHKCHRGSWQLHGHCHNNLMTDEFWTSSKRDERRRTMDVGMDTNNYKPWSIESLKKIMKKLVKYPKGLDHHQALRSEED